MPILHDIGTLSRHFTLLGCLRVLLLCDVDFDDIKSNDVDKLTYNASVQKLLNLSQNTFLSFETHG